MPEVNVTIDFSALANLIVTAFMDAIRAIAAPLPVAFTEWVLRQVQQILTIQGGSNVLTHVPLEWTSGNAEVLRMYRQTLLLNTALATLVLMVQGFRVVRGQIDLWETLMRTSFFILIGLGIPVWAGLIFQAVNAATDAIVLNDLTITDTSMPSDLVLAVMLIIGAIFAVLTWLKGAIGVVFLAVLIVIGPTFFLLSSLPIFGGLGKWWIEEFTTWTLRGLMVGMILRLGLGIGAINGGGFQFLFAIAAFWLAWGIDTKIRRFSVGAWGSVAQMGLLARGAGALAGAFTGGAGVVAGAAAAGAVATQTANSNP